jgi:glycerophosphoryl diester phosphodiesterase
VSARAAEVLANYKGRFIVESFNPLSLGNFKKLCPEPARGVLSTDYMKDEKYRKPMYLLLRALMLNRVASPAFIAYHHTDRSLSLNILRRLFGVVTFAWTVRSPEEEAAALAAGYDGVIFENYIPEDK